MSRDAILADLAIAAMATLSLVLGMSLDNIIGKFAMLWAGMLFGYVCTTYLNVEEL